MASSANATKTPARPSHEAVESSTGKATKAGKGKKDNLDSAAMESAKRGQNRIHDNEQRTPGSTTFTK